MTALIKDIIIGKLHLKNFVNLNNEELALVLAWRNSDIIKQLVAFDPKSISFPEHKAFVEGLRSRSDRCYFLIKEQDRDLGVVCLLGIDFFNRRCTWGDYTNPSLVNTGTGVILEYIALHLAFEVLGLHCLRCETLENNQAARRLHDFFGFETEGILRDYVYRREDSHYYNVIVMSINDERWKGQKVRIEKLLELLYKYGHRRN